MKALSSFILVIAAILAALFVYLKHPVIAAIIAGLFTAGILLLSWYVLTDPNCTEFED